MVSIPQKSQGRTWYPYAVEFTEVRGEIIRSESNRSITKVRSLKYEKLHIRCIQLGREVWAGPVSEETAAAFVLLGAITRGQR